MSQRRSLALAALALGLMLAPPGLAQDADNKVGEDAFRVSCAVCHGEHGDGNGEFASVLTVKPADLTTIAANTSDGVFPYLKVFQIVDGRTTVRAHGTGAMPIWGDAFKQQVVESAGPYGAELLVRAKIVALVDYVESLQK